MSSGMGSRDLTVCETRYNKNDNTRPEITIIMVLKTANDFVCCSDAVEFVDIDAGFVIIYSRLKYIGYFKKYALIPCSFRINRYRMPV